MRSMVSSGISFPMDTVPISEASTKRGMPPTVFLSTERAVRRLFHSYPGAFTGKPRPAKIDSIRLHDKGNKES